jgi:NAD(P)-dependent dehydrogenase (short-subunit alcohol dehydrogenase family)
MTNVHKVALITGAGSGIGKAVAIAMAGVGYHVVAAGRRIAILQDVAAAAGGNVLPMTVDVVDRLSVAELFEAVKQRFGRLDVLFNNAGTGAPGIPLEDLSVEQWRSVIDVNTTGTFYCTQEAFKLMKVQTPMGGRIINNGSISASAPRPNSAPYTASKHAVSGLTKATSLDGRKYNIACGQIDIGNARTSMAETLAVGALQADLSVRPEPTLDLAHVASAVLYMASLPLDANVQWLTVTPPSMPYIGRG